MADTPTGRAALFTLLYSCFMISKWNGKSLSRSQDTVSQYCSVSQGKNANLSKKLEIRAFVFFLFKIMIKKGLPNNGVF